MWPISQSVTHFFQALPVFSTCNSFSQVWPNFLSVTHFSSVKPFSRLTHFPKSESFFYVWPIFASEIFQVWLIFPRADPSQLWHIFTSDPLFCFCFDPFLQVLPIFLRVTHFLEVRFSKCGWRLVSSTTWFLRLTPQSNAGCFQ